MPSGDALKALSDEELKALEGMERANVEARIALLRNVQKLLDTAVTQLNQYSTVMAAMGYVSLYIAPRSTYIQSVYGKGSSPVRNYITTLAPLY